MSRILTLDPRSLSSSTPTVKDLMYNYERIVSRKMSLKYKFENFYNGAQGKFYEIGNVLAYLLIVNSKFEFGLE